MPQFGRARCAGRGGHRSSETTAKFTNVSELWSGRVDPPGPERCRMHRSCGSATTQFPKHDPCARAAAPPARTPARPRTGSAPVGRQRRSVASESSRDRGAPRHRADSPACVIGRALRVDMKNDGEAVAPRDRSTGGRDGPRRMVRMARYQTPRRARGPDPPARQGPTTQQRVTL